jgi:histidinol-phosphate aminotransferase
MHSFIQDSAHLSSLSRFRVSEGRDLINGLRLDRNERVEDWPHEFASDIFKNAPSSLLSTYPDQTRLYELLSTFHNIPIAQLLLTSGIDGGLQTIFQLCTHPGDRVGVLSPTYAMYDIYSKIHQVNLQHLGYNEDLSLDLDAIFNFIETKPKILFLPNPNQPIEDTFGNNTTSIIAEKCLDSNTLLVLDEAYHLFGADTAIPLVTRFPNLVVTRTFSKAFGVPSIRLGYLVTNEGNLSILSKSRLAHESNSLSNYVAEYLLTNFHIVQSYVDEVISSRSDILQYFHDLSIPARSQLGNYVLVDLGNSALANACVQYLRDNLIYVKGPWREPYENYFSITLGPVDKMLRFKQAFTQFSNSHLR